MTRIAWLMTLLSASTAVPVPLLAEERMFKWVEQVRGADAEAKAWMSSLKKAWERKTVVISNQSSKVQHDVCMYASCTCILAFWCVSAAIYAHNAHAHMHIYAPMLHFMHTMHMHACMPPGSLVPWSSGPWSREPGP